MELKRHRFADDDVRSRIPPEQIDRTLRAAQEKVTSDLQRTLSSGDAEDHAKILLRADAAPTIEWLDVASLPQRPVDRNTAAAERKFNREELPWQEDSWSKGADESPDYAHFYEDVYRSLRAGAPLAITPQSVRRTLSVLEECRRVP